MADSVIQALGGGFKRSGAVDRPNVISIEVDQGPIDQLLTVFSTNQVKRALYRSIMRTLNTARARITQSVGKVLNTKTATIRDAITTRAGSFEELAGKIIISRKPIRAEKFIGAAIRKGSISVQFRKDKGRIEIGEGKTFASHVLPHSGNQLLLFGDGVDLFLFRARHLPEKGPHADRTYKRRRRIFSKDGDKPIPPIRGLTLDGFAGKYAVANAFGPSVYSAMGGDDHDKSLFDATVTDMTAVFEKNFSSQIDLLVARRQAAEGGESNG
jgi:hypothetical protein